MIYIKILLFGRTSTIVFFITLYCTNTNLFSKNGRIDKYIFNRIKIYLSLKNLFRGGFQLRIFGDQDILHPPHFPFDRSCRCTLFSFPLRRISLYPVLFLFFWNRARVSFASIKRFRMRLARPSDFSRICCGITLRNWILGYKRSFRKKLLQSLK